MKSFYVGLTPWLAFGVADRSAGLGPFHAALVGLVVALGITVFELRGRQLRPLPFIAAAEFTALTAISVHVDTTAGIWRYDRALAIGALAATFVVSSLVAPLTAPYTRDVVTPRHWTDRRFLRANATLTRSWSLVLTLVAASAALGATFQDPLGTTVFNWLLPIFVVALATPRLAVPSESNSGASAVPRARVPDEQRARERERAPRPSAAELVAKQTAPGPGGATARRRIGDAPGPGRSLRRMAVAAARVDDLERGDLPALCAKTGEPCAGLVKDTLRVVPRWVSALVVFAIVPYYVGRIYASRRIEAKLPVAPGRLERVRRLVRAAWVALVSAAAGLAATLFGAGAVGLAALVAGLVAYVVIVYTGDQMWVGARPSHRSDVVILTRLHPDFTRALDDFYDERAAAGSRRALPSGY